MKMRKFMRNLALAGIMVLGMGIFAGCGAKTQEAASLAESGVLLLRVNPEIEIKYDKDGHVLSVQGVNKDGKDIVEGYQDYVGKECREVVGDLVKEIHKAGYFVEEVEGQNKKITIEIETGSILPDEEFLNEIVTDIQQYVTDMQMHSPIVLEGESDYGMTDWSLSDYGEAAYEKVVPAGSESKPQTDKPAAPAQDTTKPPVKADPSSPYSPYGTTDYGTSPYTPYEAASPYTPYEAETPYTPYEEASPYTPYEEASPYTPYEEASPYTPYEETNYGASAYTNYETSNYSDYQ